MNCPFCYNEFDIIDEEKNGFSRKVSRILFICRSGCNFTCCHFIEDPDKWRVWTWGPKINIILGEDLSSIDECFRRLKLQSFL